MKSKGIFEVKAKLSEICQQVAESKEPVEVTRRGRPLVHIVPAEGIPTSALQRRIFYLSSHDDSVNAADFEMPD